MQVNIEIKYSLVSPLTAGVIGWISDSYCSIKPLCSVLADPTSPIPSHCSVIILFQSVAVHQLS